MNESNIYPRTGDRQTVYLKHAVKKIPVLLSGTIPYTTTLFITLLTLKKTMCCTTIPSTRTGW